MKNILFFSTLDLNIKSFCYEHILKLSKDNKIIVLTNYSQKKKIFNNKNIIEKNTNIFRQINILFDLVVFINLIFILFQNRVDLLITITPKAGFLGSLAGFILGIKKRLHIFTGQIWVNKVGFSKFFFIFFDRLIISMATNILFDSLSQIKFTEKYFGKYKKFHVINHGSINGVNTNIFKPSPQKNYLRKKLKIKKNDIVLIYAGRLNKDKGIEKLIEVFLYLEKSFRNLKLILVGIDEDNLKYKFKSLENIYIFKHQEKLANFFQLSDIFCSFSSREGFGVSIIQASASCLPIFCSDIYGFKDSIKNNYTGIKFNTRSNKITISKKLSILINKKSLRVKFGRQGRNYVKKYFEQEKVINHYNKYFKNLLK